MKQRLVRALRDTGLLSFVDRVRFWAVKAKYARRNRAFLGRHPGTILPPKFLMYDAYAHVNYQEYFQKGRTNAEYIASVVARHLGSGRAVTVCEWGCGPGRIIRHLPQLLAPGSRVFGTDYNERTIAWCSANLPEVTFRLNGLAPPLPFSTGELDLLYAVSVLTHLSEEMHIAWMAECERVVRPGGLILLTVHGDQSISGLSEQERAEYDAGELVVRGKVKEGSRTFVAFQSPRFMRETLLRNVDLVLHNPPDAPMLAGPQDVYLVRTRERARLEQLGAAPRHP
jgi:SAM-dependent methyltransferase